MTLQKALFLIMLAALATSLGCPGTRHTLRNPPGDRHAPAINPSALNKELQP